MHKRTFLLLPLLLWPARALAHSAKIGDILIGHAWALPSQQNEGQVFFPLANNGKETDSLVAARSEICATIELRQNNHYDDPPLQAIVLEPGKPVPMRPTARHLRLIGLTKPLVEHQQFSMILDFEKAGEAEITVIVQARPGE